VDDVILVRNFITKIDKIKTSLHEAFKIKDLGSLKYFFDFEVARSSKRNSLVTTKVCSGYLILDGNVGVQA